MFCTWEGRPSLTIFYVLLRKRRKKNFASSEWPRKKGGCHFLLLLLLLFSSFPCVPNLWKSPFLWRWATTHPTHLIRLRVLATWGKDQAPILRKVNPLMANSRGKTCHSWSNNTLEMESKSRAWAVHGGGGSRRYLVKRLLALNPSSWLWRAGSERLRRDAQWKQIKSPIVSP